MRLFENRRTLMTQLQKALLACLSALVLSLFASGAWGQSAPVFVSGGPFIYNVTSCGESHTPCLVKVYDATLNGGVATTNNKYTGPYYSSLAIGPDNVDLETNGHGNAAHPFLIYACDDNTNTIIRFAPGGAVTTANPTADVVYNGGTESSLTPVCGRFSSIGDFYVTKESAPSTGVIVYKFTGPMNTPLANVPLGMLPASGLSPTQVSLSGLSTNAASAGITQKNTGDLLLVDHANNQVLRSPYGSPFTTVSSYISTNLSNPVGIARVSTGDVFVANQGSSNVAHFDRTGNLVPTGPACPSLTFPDGATNTRLFFLAASETDTIYAVASTTVILPGPIDEFIENQDFVAEGDNPGEVWSWSPGQACNLQHVAFSATELYGVAVAPVPTATITLPVSSTTANPTPTSFNFNTDAAPSSVFQLTANGCTVSVTAYPLNVATVNTAIGLAASSLPDGATPLVNLGEGGYETAYVTKETPACTSVFSDGSFARAIFGLYDSTVAGNPRVIQCESGSPPNFDDPSEPLLNVNGLGSSSCVALTTVGSYPLGGPIPFDPGVIGTGKGGHSTYFLVNAKFAGGGTTPQAIFCGFFPPLKNTTDPTQAAKFDDDDIIPVVFRLAKATGNCNTGPFDNSAKALLSIAQLTPNFKAIFPLKTFPQAGKFQNIGFGLYINFLPVHANQLNLGTYSLSVLFQTDDTTQQAIEFNVVRDKD
jgi:hypothetical protein